MTNKIKIWGFGAASLAVAAFGIQALKADDHQLMGFSKANSKNQLSMEKQYDAMLDSENLDAWMKYITSRPHHLGSAFGKEKAEWIRDQFASWGYDAQLVRYDVLFPTPKIRMLEMVAPTTYTATLKEDAVEGDSTSDQDDRLPPYVAFSPDGEVTAEVVFVNQGLKADYEDLARRGIDVKGKIVLAKYGGSWRGIKPKLAEEMGAIGTLIYTDPGDDGYSRGDSYPKGPMKHPSGVQRGSIMDLPMRPGDPSTPYVASKGNVDRLDLEDIEVFVGIPTLPISYVDALPILKALEGPVAPARWTGGLPITYHMGPGPAKVHLKLEFNWDIVPLYNVVAKMEGSELPDEWVMRGNHHDAWVHGASDPTSGMVALMEEARVVAELAKQGMKPKRTLIYAGWDGEEQGLIGSVEWVEDHRDELAEKLVAYINTDGNGRGFLGAGGSHTLEKMFAEIANDVKDPIHTDLSVAERRLTLRKVMGDAKAFKDDRYRLSALGSGSDYSGFFQHLGIASLNVGFGGEGSSGSYHTNYDSYDHYTRFRDIDFKYGKALAQVAGRATLRLANADLLPFEFTRVSETVGGYFDEIKSSTDKMRKDVAQHNALLKAGAYDIASDPTKNFVDPEAKDEVPYLDFSPVENALVDLEKAAKAFDKMLKAMKADDYGVAKSKLASINHSLQQAEQMFTRQEGLPRRPWFRHHIYAPGFYTGYGVKTLPGVREGIEEYKFDEAQQQINKLAEVIGKYVENINSAM